ncbi:cytochrome c oxidase subunit II [Haloarchaeobius sp. TZWSO28]|uniref:cytochrome c oxidase subunit II n=1 Tax=Haloarchaeobius sp. TZWSO28 TaxID=3446119 RepID=UPI003EC0AAB9
MNAKRLAPTALLGAAFLLLLADPVAAQASTTEEAIRGLNEKLLVVAIPITVLVEGVLIYTVLKYRKSDEAKPTRENRRLEITWTVATAVILLFVGLSATMTMADPAIIADGVDDRADVPSDAEHIGVEARTYAWTFTYDKHNVTSSQKLVIPKDQETYFNVTTQDWLHAVHVPALGLKQDAVPGQNHYLMTEAKEVGTYQGYCAEYCGVGHSGMMFEVEVMPQDEYQDWLKSQCEDAGGSWDAGAQTCTAGNSSSSSSAVAA